MFRQSITMGGNGKVPGGNARPSEGGWQTFIRTAEEDGLGESRNGEESASVLSTLPVKYIGNGDTNPFLSSDSLSLIKY